MSIEPFSDAIVSIIEDDDDLRALIEDRWAEQGLMVRAFASGRACLEGFIPQQAGCIVLDLHLRDLDGRELIRRLRKRGARQPVIVITGSRDVHEVIDAMHLGVQDILTKPIDLSFLDMRVRQALATDVEIRRRSRSDDYVAERLEQVTPREREIAQLVARGLITKEIASRLGISRKTVEVHRSHVVQKLGVESVAQMVRMVINHLPRVDSSEPSDSAPG